MHASSRRCLPFFVGLGLCLAVVSSVFTLAAAEDSFYRGKTIRIVVAFSPGGGFDVLYRIAARRLPQYIPGNPSFIVQNMPGGGNTIGVNYVYNVAKPDGLTIGTVHGNKIIQQMTKVPGIEFDITRFNWLGGDDLGSVALGIRKDLPYRTAEDLRKAEKPLYIPASIGSNSADYALILNKYAGLNLKPVYGFHSTNDAILAIRRGEGDGRSGSLPTLRRFLDLLRIVISSEAARRDVPDITVDKDLVTSPEGRALIDSLQLPQRIGRGSFLPPGVPQDRVAMLRAGWDKLIRDPDFLAEVKKAILVNPEDLLTAEEAEQVITRVRSLPEKTWEQLVDLRKAGAN